MGEESGFWGAVRCEAAEASGEQSMQGLGYQAVGLGTSPRDAGEPWEGHEQGRGRGSTGACVGWPGGEKPKAGSQRESGDQDPDKRGRGLSWGEFLRMNREATCPSLSPRVQLRHVMG